MVFSKISQVAHYVPEQLVTNDDLANIMDTSHEWIFSRTGIAQRHITRDEMTSDLASRVAEQLLARSGLEADLIDFIIVAFALFIFVKIANTIIRKEEPEEEIDTNTVLLTEIRDLLKTNK